MELSPPPVVDVDVDVLVPVLDAALVDEWPTLVLEALSPEEEDPSLPPVVALPAVVSDAPPAQPRTAMRGRSPLETARLMLVPRSTKQSYLS